MAQLVGKYQFVSSSPNFEAYLKAIEIPADRIKPTLAAKPVYIVSEAGDKWTIKINVDGKEISSNTFKFGENFDEAVGDKFLKSVATRDGNKITTVGTTAEGRVHTKVIEFTADGFNLTVTDGQTGMSSSQVFQRV